MYINTNHTPPVDATEHATWRTLKTRPGPYTFVRQPADGEFKEGEKLGDKTLRPYIQHGDTVPAAALRWIVIGAMRWYLQREDPIDPPKPVQEATRAWRADSDVAFQFATE